MASSLETNKVVAAVLAAGIVASGSGVVSRILYRAEIPEENAYQISVLDEGGGEEGGDGDGGATVSLAALIATGDPGGGEQVAKKCTSCHSFEEGGPNKIGPNLYGILDRDIAAVAGFAYSEALTSLDGTWDYDALGGFLADPKGYAPGTKMTFAGVNKPEDLADLILYLRSLGATDVPLPEAPAEQASDEAAAVEGGDGATEVAVADAGEAAEPETEEAVATDTEAAAEEPEQEVAAAEGEGSETEEVVATDTEAAAEEPEQEVATAEGEGSETEEVVATDTEAAAEEPEQEVATAEGEGSETEEAIATDTEATAEEPEQEVAASKSAGGGEEQVAAVETEPAKDEADGAAGGDEGLGALLAQADVEAGAKDARKCATCHVFEPDGSNKIGPPLWGVVGRDVASIEDFRYSDALGDKGGQWDYEALDAYLADPKAWAPGNKMAFAGIKKPEDRADLILYLRSLADAPAPLP